jgi:hypothetical protein
MRLLLDQSFPETASSFNTQGSVEIDRWTGATLTDADFIASAAELDYDAVVFLGRSFVADMRSLALAVARGVRVIVTASDEPMRATTDLSRQLSSVARRFDEGAWVVEVLSSGVREIPTGPT